MKKKADFRPKQQNQIEVYMESGFDPLGSYTGARRAGRKAGAGQ